MAEGRGGGGGGKKTLIHAVALRSDRGGGGGGVGAFHTRVANFCDGTFIWGIQNDTVMRWFLFVCLFGCLSGFMFLFSLS